MYCILNTIPLAFDGGARGWKFSFHLFTHMIQNQKPPQFTMNSIQMHELQSHFLLIAYRKD